MIIRKLTATAIAATVMIGVSSPVFAAAPKAGAKCTKVGLTATSAGKKFTCVKSGTKLVWNKGAALPKPMPNSQPTQSQPIESLNLLNSDPRIMPKSKLTDLSICKTTDMTPGAALLNEVFHQNGFPRPSVTISGKKTAKVLVIPLSFKNLPFNNEKLTVKGKSTSDIQMLNESIPRVVDFYNKLSNGKFEIKIDVLPESEWWNFNFDHPFKNAPQYPNLLKLFDLINNEKSQYKFEGYDAFVFLGGTGEGNITGTAGFGDQFKNAAGGTINSVLMVGAHDDESIWVHEFGHALFALEDLYLFNPSKASTKDETAVPASWDLMASNKPSLLRWNRLLMGWLPDDKVRCISDQLSGIHYLAKSEMSEEPQILTINLSPGVTLAAEVRSTTAMNMGVLLYTVNTHIQSGQGPVQVQKSLLVKGQSKSWLGWKFNVLDSDNDGVLIEVIKTDVDKFIPPAPQPKPSNPLPTTSLIKYTKSEVISISSERAKSTWDVLGHQSFRVYVTASNDFQKVYFESGYINDTKSPLILEMSGLPCSKDLRTMAEFYSEKDGKGERLVIENKQLASNWCEVTTKKP